MVKTLKIFGIVLGAAIVLFLAVKFFTLEKGHKMKDVTAVSITLPHTFKTKEAEQLSIEAFDLWKAGRYDGAIRLYRRALRIEPDNPRLFFDLSSCYSKMNYLDQAVVELTNAISLDDSYAGFYSNRGLYNYKLRRVEDAIRDLEKAVELDSSNWAFYANLALAYKSANNQDQACRALKTATRLGLDLATSQQDDLQKLVEICE